MAKTRQIINAFSGGEISPRLYGRTDLENYNQGCNKVTNMLAYIQGGLAKRPGTDYIATASGYDNPVRVIPFRYSTEQAYILEFGHEYMRVFKDGGQIYDGITGVPVQISTDYDSEDLFQLRYAQTADTMYIVHPEYSPKVLTRTSHTEWTLEDASFYKGPFLDDNTSAITMTPSATTGNITITASVGYFDPYHLGSKWLFRGDIQKSATIVAENSFTSSLELNSGESLIWSVGGSGWDATVRLLKSYDGGSTWIDALNTTDNISLEVTEIADGVWYKSGVKTGEYTSGTIDTTIIKRNASGYATCTSYVSSNVINATVNETLPSTDATIRWAEGAWSVYRGYPAAVMFSNQRLIMASTYYQPQTFWGSQIDDYANFDVGVSLDDEAFNFTIASTNVNTIQWLVDAQSLIGGTAAGEWVLSEPGKGITPTTPYVKQQTGHGSANISGIIVGHTILFIQENPAKMRSLSYDYRIEGYASSELSLRAEHLLRTGEVVDWCYAEKPDPVVYMIMDTGDMIVCSYEPNAGVVAFSTYDTDGDFESVATIPGTDRDEVWVVANRDAGPAGNIRCIEQFTDLNWYEPEDYRFMDATITYEGPAKTTISGLQHLEGQEVAVLVDGAVHPNITVSGGVATLQQYYEGEGNVTVHIGLPYTAYFQTTRLNPQTEMGSSLGKLQTLYDLNIDFHNTVGFKISSNKNAPDYVGTDLESTYFETVKRFSIPIMNEGSVPYSGIYNKTIKAPWDKEQYITILNDQPLPFNVRSMAYTIEAKAR